MPPRSLVAGDYRLVMAVESSSRRDSFYRVLADTSSGALSCDCPRWTFNAERRACKHTRTAERLRHGGQALLPDGRLVSTTHPLIAAAREQWPGLLGTWEIEERDADLQGSPYRFVLLRLRTGNGMVATGLVAFARRHDHTLETMTAAVAGWAGYGIAAAVAQASGFRLAGQPPEHFRTPKRRGGAERPGVIGLREILRVGERPDLGDGLSATQRAENTLRLFLGPLYADLERDGFLDIASNYFPGRVYRLRRDPQRRMPRRVRIFEQGHYCKDFCIMPAAAVPEADHLLTLFLMLLSDERKALAVLGRYNIFPPYSDSRQREDRPAVWQPRDTPAAA